jgi:hypothetical protein
MNDFLRKLLEAKFQETKKFSAVGTMTEQEKADHKELCELVDQMEAMSERIDTLKDHLWSGIKIRTGVHGRNMRVNPETGEILAEIEAETEN